MKKLRRVSAPTFDQRLRLREKLGRDVERCQGLEIFFTPPFVSPTDAARVAEVLALEVGRVLAPQNALVVAVAAGLPDVPTRATARAAAVEVVGAGAAPLDPRSVRSALAPEPAEEAQRAAGTPTAVAAAATTSPSAKSLLADRSEVVAHRYGRLRQTQKVCNVEIVVYQGRRVRFSVVAGGR